MSRQNNRQSITRSAKDDRNQLDEPSNCIICLEKVSTRGKLSVCSHWFCYPCILEWSQNTNTCPICKARFRCVTKVHLSPFKSPPSKVRIGDRDQRVWNDDDDLVTEDVLAAIDEDDFDDDYEPPIHVSSPWTMASGRRRGRQGTRHARESVPDDYDSTDSFIDDTDLTQQQAYYHDITYTEPTVVIDDDNNNNNSDFSEDSNSSTELLHLQRHSPYRLRSSRDYQRRITNGDARNSVRVFEVEEQLCSSPAGTSSFIMSDDDSSDELNSNWVPFGKHNNSRSKTNSKSKTRKKAPPKRGDRLLRERGKKVNTRQDNSSRVPTGKEPSSTSKLENQSTYSSASGWISMAEKRSQPNASTSSSQKRRRASTRTSRKATEKLKLTKNGESSTGNSSDGSSDWELEDLSSRIRRKKVRIDCKRQQLKKNSQSVGSYVGKFSNSFPSTSKKNSSKMKQQEDSPAASTSTVEVHEAAENISSVPEDDFANIRIILPTPRSEEKRSILTRRQHRSPGNTFDDFKDDPNTDIKEPDGTLCREKISAHHRRTETISSSRRDTPLNLSPLVKKAKVPRKRILPISSDSE